LKTWLIKAAFASTTFVQLKLPGLNRGGFGLGKGDLLFGRLDERYSKQSVPERTMPEVIAKAASYKD